MKRIRCEWPAGGFFSGVACAASLCAVMIVPSPPAALSDPAPAAPAGIEAPSPAAAAHDDAAASPGLHNPAIRWLRISTARLATPRTLAILAVGGALAAAGTRIENPRRDARFFERPMFDGGADFGNAYGDAATLGLGTAGLIATGWVTGNREVGATGREMARALLYAAAITVPTKAAFGRTRPNGGRYSFPSGHSAAAFAIAPVLANHLGGKVGALAYLAAAATAAGRIEENKHYLSDVLFGAAIGIAAGTTAIDDTPHGSTPSLVVGHSGIGLGIRF